MPPGVGRVIDDAPPPPVAAFLVGIVAGLVLAAAVSLVLEALFR